MPKHVFNCIDAHTCGNPVRLVKTGGPNLVGDSMNAKRLHFLKEFDWIRTGLMFEPRGHDMMSGSILYPPHDPQNDCSILFIETSGCLPMCGHGTIGTVTIALEEGLLEPKTPGKIHIEAPAGLVEAAYFQNSYGKVEWVELTNVESYLAASGLEIECEGLGTVVFDVAYGGNFYAIIEAQESYSDVNDYAASDLIRLSKMIRERINTRYPNQFIHPENTTIREVSHVLWTGAPKQNGSTARNAVFYGDKAIDRSPCGTGTSARMAQLYAKGRLKEGEPFVHESIIGSTFTGHVKMTTTLGQYKAIVPVIRGWAKVYGVNTITIDTDDDPYAHGFQVV